ncbi:hypothetical protein GWI33_007039, partial [Rhynchophorus ferrugineus]
MELRVAVSTGAFRHPLHADPPISRRKHHCPSFNVRPNNLSQPPIRSPPPAPVHS